MQLQKWQLIETLTVLSFKDADDGQLVFKVAVAFLGCSCTCGQKQFVFFSDQMYVGNR